MVAKKNYRKKPVKRKNTRRKVQKKSGITMNKVLSKMCITKIHDFTGIDFLHPFGTDVQGTVPNQQWYLHFPANLPRVNTNNVQADLTSRESSRIHMKNIRYNLSILPDRHTYNPLQYRVVFGYFKGDDNAGTQALTPSSLKAMFPKITSNLKSRGPSVIGTVPGGEDLYIRYQSKVFTVTPKMVYDANGSDDNTTASEIVIGSNSLTEGAEPMRGVWLPRTHNFNFQINRTLSYEGVDGDTLNGWCPFFAIQMVPVEFNYSRPNVISDTDRTKWGNYPCPLIQMNCKSYFCDIN